MISGKLLAVGVPLIIPLGTFPNSLVGWGGGGLHHLSINQSINQSKIFIVA